VLCLRNNLDDFVKSLAACPLGPSSARELTLVSARGQALRDERFMLKCKKGTALPLFPKERTKRRNYSPYIAYRQIWRIT